MHWACLAQGVSATLCQGAERGADGCVTLGERTSCLNSPMMPHIRVAIPCLQSQSSSGRNFQPKAEMSRCNVMDSQVQLVSHTCVQPGHADT